MSQIHKCNDGTMDVTDRGTPRDYVPCSTRGGEVGSTPISTNGTNVQTAGFGGNIPKVVWWVAGLGAIYYIGKQQKWF